MESYADPTEKYNDEDFPGSEDQNWVCSCGRNMTEGVHCSDCGKEPPWGCPCDKCAENSAGILFAPLSLY